MQDLLFPATLFVSLFLIPSLPTQHLVVTDPYSYSVGQPFTLGMLHLKLRYKPLKLVLNIYDVKDTEHSNISGRKVLNNLLSAKDPERYSEEYGISDCS